MRAALVMMALGCVACGASSERFEGKIQNCEDEQPDGNALLIIERKMGEEPAVLVGFANENLRDTYVVVLASEVQEDGNELTASGEAEVSADAPPNDFELTLERVGDTYSGEFVVVERTCEIDVSLVY